MGRNAEEKEYKSDEFHLLAYEPDMTTFTEVSAEAETGTIAAIDTDGEIWIIAGTQTNGNLNLSNAEGQARDISRPIPTNWMAKLGCRATKLRLGFLFIVVQTESISTGARGVKVFRTSKDENFKAFDDMVEQ